MRRRATSWVFGLRLLCVVALAFAGLAHRPAMAMPSLEFAAYVLPDGTLPDICVDDAVHGRAKLVPAKVCEACRIGGAMLVPEPSGLDGLPPLLGAARLPMPAGAVLVVRRERPGAPPRAPPLAAL